MPTRMFRVRFVRRTNIVRGPERRFAVPWLVALLLVGCALNAASARPRPSKGPQPKIIADGEHWRLVTPSGPVHVWRPKLYDHATAGVVVYVHGYYTDADGAWTEHRLADQFRRSRRNALFLVPEAPSSAAQGVVWTDPEQLWSALIDGLGIAVPYGPLIIAGHSGGFRTIVEWLPSGQVDQVVLLDGLYGGQAELLRWMESREKYKRPYLVLVPTSSTERETQRLAAAARDAETIPLWVSAGLVGDIAAKVLVLGASTGHMELVTDGHAIPATLSLTALAGLPDS